MIIEFAIKIANNFKIQELHTYLYIYIYAHTKRAYKSLVTSRKKPSEIRNQLNNMGKHLIPLPKSITIHLFLSCHLLNYY